MSSFRNRSGQNVEPIVDESGILPMMDKAHHDTHRGVMWQISEARASVDTNGVFYLIKVGAKELHLSYGAKIVGQGIIVTFFEAPVTTADGTEIMPVNKNRRLAAGATALTSSFFFGPTITNNGSQLDIDAAPAGATGGSGGGQISNTYQFVLKPSTNYLMKIAAQANNGTAYVHKDFYEVAV